MMNLSSWSSFNRGFETLTSCNHHLAMCISNLRNELGLWCGLKVNLSIQSPNHSIRTFNWINDRINSLHIVFGNHNWKISHKLLKLWLNNVYRIQIWFRVSLFYPNYKSKVEIKSKGHLWSMKLENEVYQVVKWWNILIFI